MYLKPLVAIDVVDCVFDHFLRSVQHPMQREIEQLVRFRLGTSA
jgi:hypothetical protein